MCDCTVPDIVADYGKPDLAVEFEKTIERLDYKTKKDYSKVIGHIVYK